MNAEGKMLTDELMELFGVKTNPVVSFWFIKAEYIKDGTTQVPDGYTLYKEAEYHGSLWQCYGKKEVRGVFSDRYWKK